MKGKAILICGKICSGKSWYTERLMCKKNAVMLSCDELAFALFDGDLGEMHDEITARIKKYFYQKSIEILESGTDVILEWGFWKREWRDEARKFYKERGIASEFHYIDISDEDWHRNIEIRNKAVSFGESRAYYLDDGLMQKLESLFEKPEESEIDVWYYNCRSK